MKFREIIRIYRRHRKEQSRHAANTQSFLMLQHLVHIVTTEPQY